MLQIQFSSKQEFQIAAVESVARLFEGLPNAATEFQLSDEIVSNLPPFEDLQEDWLLDNLNAVQRDPDLKHGDAKIISENATLDTDEGLVLEGVGEEVVRYPSFTIEMETGTGKTYCYLRSVYELRKRYGFSKFIIVVPSVAIYEGVAKTFAITQSHFRALYDNETVDLIRYDGAQMSRIRTFSTTTSCQVLLMTLDSFNKTSNNLFKSTEKLPGERKPYEFVQETRPILILDEPQNMGSDKSKAALRTLHPLFALRYSATHKESPNLVFRLSPFDAFRLGLVKRIQVDGVTERENANQIDGAPLLALQSVSGTGANIRANVLALSRSGNTSKEAQFALRKGDDLKVKTHRDEYAGYLVQEIETDGEGGGTLEFENGVRLASGGMSRSKPEIFRVQIERAIEEHFRRQEELRGRGIKVLSLFFIDRVANYTDDDGLIKTLFDKAFNSLKRGRPEWEEKEPATVRSAYFAQKKGRNGMETVETRDVEDERKNADEKAAEKEAFSLIMRDKEKLLGFEEPVSFIFAHSALREGWDNPNVFQICTLNQTVSTNRKRQEIGRGLRLCVDQTGDRVAGDDVNILTVVANASYKDYAEKLQSEYVEDGDSAPPAPSDARKAPAQRNDVIFQHPQFRTFWKKLHRRALPSFNLDTDKLVEECGNRLNGKAFSEPIIVVERGKYIQTRLTLQLDKILPDGRAKVRVVIIGTDGDEREVAVTVKVGDNLKQKTGEDRLRSFRVSEIKGEGDAATMTFGNEIVLTPHDAFSTDTAEGFTPTQSVKMAPREVFPVPNLLDRAARETGLTRPTINRIWKKLRPEIAKFLLKNPENFIATFIAEVTNALADHITTGISFSADGAGGAGPSDEALEVLFPVEKKFTQRELIDAGAKGLYDQVQTDSEVERRFVNNIKNEGALVFYFKFPATFKVPLPKQIGNYNPDWGLARLDENKATIHFIRETKGSTKIETLRFPAEIRKIKCAQKYFKALDLDYRPIDDTVADWWTPWMPAAKLAVE